MTSGVSLNFRHIFESHTPSETSMQLEDTSENSLERRKVLLSVKRLNSKTDQLFQFRLSLFSEDKVCINKEDDSDKSGMVYEVHVPVVHFSDTAGQSRPRSGDTVHNRTLATALNQPF